MPLSSGRPTTSSRQPWGRLIYEIKHGHMPLMGRMQILMLCSWWLQSENVLFRNGVTGLFGDVLDVVWCSDVLRHVPR